MNIASAIMHIYPNANPMGDFIVQDNGAEPILRAGVDGRFRYEIRPLEEDETEYIEGVHYRYVVDFNRLVEGVDYDIVERGQFIASWNLDEPQPTEAELQIAWEAYQEAEANKPPKLTEVEQLQEDNAALMLELAQTQAKQEQAEQDQASLLLSLVEGGVL
ncbi:XkdW family protein [Paenibacillus sp. FSL K6-0276]|uniref:XkdW family protein n=1 Tax=Paenibacillus sp. FSL K6-0276 TaxID=2921450 RepID=UPI0030EE11CD